MLLSALPESIFDEITLGTDSAFLSPAFRIETGFVTFGHTGTGDAYDLFQIRPGIGQFRLLVTSDPLSQLGSNTGWGSLASDFTVYIRDSQGNILKTQDVSGPDAYPDQLTFSTNAAGTFYVDIRSTSGAALSYAATLVDLNAVANALAPTVSISDDVSGVANKSTAQIAYQLTFSSAVTGLDATDITLTHAQLSSIEGSGTSWTVRVAPDQNVGQGAIGLALAAGAVTDALGNRNAAASTYFMLSTASYVIKARRYAVY